MQRSLVFANSIMAKGIALLGIAVALMSFGQRVVATASDLPVGRLLYHSAMDSAASVDGWRMEGPGELAFRDGWMEVFSPEQAMHHVFWCPEDFPASFIAQWQVQNRDTKAGLVIVFFAAQGIHGEDIFDLSLAPRDGTFTHYTEGDIRSYHISYYANAAHNPGRGYANLRKNNTFTLLQQGKEGIATKSEAIHDIVLIKKGARIQMRVDNRVVIDYVDNQPIVEGVDTGASLSGGKIGFRQMQWTRFRYRDFRVNALPDIPDAELFSAGG